MSGQAAYRASPIKRHRRTKAEIARIRQGILAVVRADRPVTVRQVFYRLVSLGLVDKTENEYRQTVARLLVELRQDGTIDYADIADATRWMRKPQTFGSARDALRHWSRAYRQAVWSDLDQYVEVWLEKDALAGVVVEVTREYDVPLMVTRGQPSLSFTYSAAQAIASQADAGRTVTIYYLGDYDPAGVDIARSVERQLREFSSVDDDELRFRQLAVNREQIETMKLSTRPTKRTDPRAERFGDDRSVDVDAIPPAVLRSMVRQAIETHLPAGWLASIEVAEESERAILANIIGTLRGAA